MNIYAKINITCGCNHFYGIYKLIKIERGYVWYLSDLNATPTLELNRGSRNNWLIDFKESDLNDNNLIKEKVCSS